MTDRVSRFLRRERQSTLVLTPRDEAIILACWDHRWLTRDQIRARVPLPGVGRSNDRLRRLYDAGFLDRLRAGTVGSGLQPVYVVGEAAIPVIAAQTGLPERVVRARIREDAGASAVLLPHDLQVNDLRLALTQALAANPEVTLDLWLNAAECLDPYSSQHALRPDGYFRFWHRDVLSAFFVELDRGTTSLARWRTKCERYVEYREGGHYTARYGLTRFRVLTTVPSLQRLAQLRRTTALVSARSFWFAELDEVLGASDPMRPVWQTVGTDGLRPLIDEEGAK